MEISKLKEILEQHRLWIETNGVQGKCADLEGANLFRANLRGAKLWGANLRDANLRGADLYGADLEGAKFSDANLRGADLTVANLRGAKFSDADLSCASLIDTNLSRANLQGANLTHADLKDANLKDANLGGADLTGANLHCADFYNTILPDISWIIPGCLVQLNDVKYGLFYLEKENKFENFIQDSLGFFIQNNPIEKTFDMLAGDRIIRNIPDWVKYTGLKQIASESV